MPAKIDLYKIHKDAYAAPKTPVFLTIAPAKYLAIRGKGRPGGPMFTAAIGALYGAAFTIKMAYKFSGRQDYAVCKLEGLWFAKDFVNTKADDHTWQLMIRTPDFITKSDLKTAVATLLKRGKPNDVTRVTLETIKEGRCVQMLHVGPYDRESETIERMRAFAAEHGLVAHGHHEIYLSDPRRVAAAKLKTILREPLQAL